ncbi:MAG TPA: alanyl-tRNA synthetase [Balneolaceae bacterium]|nr:alanyl-tRNA synthetase [Balneolaceae bacterium]
MRSLPTKDTSGLKKILKRFGIAGFLFFFIKGLVWLAVLYFGVQFF